jgi:hypothetical protein
VDLVDPEAMGFAPREREADLSVSFNELPLATTQGKALEIEMFGNTLDSYFRFFTGDARITEAGQVVVGGSVSGDEFAEASQQFLKKLGL